MAVAIKSLADGTVQATVSDGNLLPAVAAGKTVLVKSIRFVNTGSADAILNIYFKAGMNGTRRFILPKALKLPPGYSLEDNQEITLEADDRLEGESGPGTVDFLISGIEREVV